MRKIKTKIEMRKGKKKRANKKASGNMKWKSKGEKIKESKKHLQHTKKRRVQCKRKKEGEKTVIRKRRRIRIA